MVLNTDCFSYNSNEATNLIVMDSFISTQSLFIIRSIVTNKAVIFSSDNFTSEDDKSLDQAVR